MKRVVQHPEPSHAEQTGPRYWRSLDELSGTPAFREYLDREFPEGASELSEVDRRHFLKIMAASFAFGGLAMTGCRRPEARIYAYSKAPENTIPGLPLYFASSFPHRRAAIPIVVETHTGRPTKIEGNPSFAAYGGTTNIFTQASILDLYDPDRATAHLQDGASASVAAVRDLLAGVAARFQASGGVGLAFLAGQSSSPTRRRLVRALKERLPGAIWAEYEPVDQAAPERAASALLRRPAKPWYHFSGATRIVSVDADFIATEEGHLQFAREFAEGRRLKDATGTMNRLYSVESAFTLAGGMADHRLRLATGQMTAFLAQLAKAVGVSGQPGIDRLAASAPADAAWVAACAADLEEAKGRSIVMPGNHLPQAAHAIALLINQTLGNLGRTVTLLETEADDAASIPDLAAAIRGGRVQSLFVLGGNPSYNAPADLEWSARLEEVAQVVHLGTHVDESSKAAAWHLKEAHYLESWGDARTADGTLVPVQPMIEPLFGGLTEIELLARILAEATPDAHSQVMATFAILARGAGEPAFRKFLHDGLLENSGYAPSTRSLDAAAATRLIDGAMATPAPSLQRLEVRFMADHKVDDGRFANNGWLQECPDPITKLTWDNAILVSPRLAEDLGITARDRRFQIIKKNPNLVVAGREVAPIAEIKLDGRTVRGPVHIQPGLASYTVVLPLGYGRAVTGRVGKDAGSNFYQIRTSGAAHAAQGATISIVEGETYQLANTQEHWSMEGRAIVREANLEEPNGYRANPGFVDTIGMESHTPPVYGRTVPGLDQRVRETPRGESLYEHPDLTGVHQWGMSIDLTTCTGCNACVVACQAENNIPIVGRDQVRRGREMHWIRIDRYYADGKVAEGNFGGAANSELIEDPQVVVQPLGCLHCESAPCETVCPVNATVHDEEGLNVMAYNRCVGTRYCANNCPYKVRRFNFFDYNQRQLDQLYLGPLGDKGMPDLVQMVKNPDVTVRMRGVMEKCTYCVQRIQEGKIHQKVKARGTDNIRIPDGTVRTACQQVCPTSAIVFGDTSDPESAVSRAKAIDRDYELLGYLNARPRTTYLARLRNPNVKMPDYLKLPLSRAEYEAKNPHPDVGDHASPDAHAEPGAPVESQGGTH
jgi:molybdopterin-containing oxidoreductase family iron-sulfur binding subunit